MNVDEIREYCLSLPQATEKLQWGDALCFKVGGKMFAVLGLDDLEVQLLENPTRHLSDDARIVRDQAGLHGSLSSFCGGARPSLRLIRDL